MGSYKPGAPGLSREEAERTIEVLNECMSEGLPLKSTGGGKPSARIAAANRLGIAPQTFSHRMVVISREYPDLQVNEESYRKATMFTVDELPDDGELSAEELIHQLAAKHRKRQAHEEAAKLRHVQVHMDGPVGIAMFGDPHIDDKGCAWGDLEHDVELVRDTPGFLAVDVGDNSNNWVGRLMRLYADQEVTPRQALVLIEWLMTALPWLVWEMGNHDAWNTEKGDPVEVMHRLMKLAGVFSDGGSTRIAMHFPAGCSATMHVRHDFPGQSQFNPAHAMVRQTLFDYRDNILVCGHRHQAGYIPIWHNDPEPRLCHGFRCGTYKDFDDYAKSKGFKDENWARAMGAVINPDLADDPVRYIHPCFSLEEAAEYLTWRREKWELGKTHA